MDKCDPIITGQGPVLEFLNLGNPPQKLLTRWSVVEMKQRDKNVMQRERMGEACRLSSEPMRPEKIGNAGRDKTSEHGWVNRVGEVQASRQNQDGRMRGYNQTGKVVARP